MKLKLSDFGQGMIWTAMSQCGTLTVRLDFRQFTSWIKFMHLPTDVIHSPLALFHTHKFNGYTTVQRLCEACTNCSSENDNKALYEIS